MNGYKIVLLKAILCFIGCRKVNGYAPEYVVEPICGDSAESVYVAVSTSCQIPRFVLSIHFPDVLTSICVEVDSRVSLGLPFYDRASGR